MLEKAINIERDEERCNEFRLYDMMFTYSTVLAQLDMFEESFKCSQEVLKYFKDFYGELDPRMARIYLGIGGNYQKAENRNEAEKYYSFAIKTYEENALDASDLREAVDIALSKI